MNNKDLKGLREDLIGELQAVQDEKFQKEEI